MKYYRICPNCNSNLDPNEKCECEGVPVINSKSNPKSFVWSEQYRRMKNELIASLNQGRVIHENN